MQQSTIPPATPLPVSVEIHKDHRSKLTKAFQEDQGNKVSGGVMFFISVPTLHVDDQDTNYYPMQEANFWYLFGVEEPDCYGVIENDTAKSILFIPYIPQSQKLWMVVKDKADYLAQYKVDEVYYVDEMEAYFKQKQPRTVFLYDGNDSYSGRKPRVPEFDWLSNYTVDRENLYHVLQECRVKKSAQELEIMKYVIKVSCDAHIDCMRSIKAGNSEFQVEALFKYKCQSTSGARFQAYDCICGQGRNAATLHYEVNSDVIKPDSLVLCDMGSKYYGYCADITCTFPVSGKFNERQKVVYNAVLDAQQEVYKMVKPGVNWGDCQLQAERTITKHLHQAGIIVGDLEQANQNRIGVLFFPHGLGHLLGLAVHDVGGFNKYTPPKSTEPGLSQLRTMRDLIPGMVITNEPGCYFVEFALNQAYEDPIKSKFLNKDLIDQYMDVGGVRLEDNFLVTETGYEILSDVPRTIEEVEACIRGENWKQRK